MYSVWSATKLIKKNLMKIFQRVLKTQVSSVVDTVTSFVTYCRKVFIHTRYKYMDGWERLIEISLPTKKGILQQSGNGERHRH